MRSRMNFAFSCIITACLVPSYQIKNIALIALIFIVTSLFMYVFNYVFNEFPYHYFKTEIRIVKSLMLFFFGGALYNLIEWIFRGYTHYSMFILGGLCFILIGVLNEIMDVSITTQMIFSACIITILEFITGMIVNKWLGLNVWDYSNLPYNLCGQISLIFFFGWFFLSILGIILDDLIRHIYCNEKMPKYRL